VAQHLVSFPAAPESRLILRRTGHGEAQEPACE
jgi:hypothetical protein